MSALKPRIGVAALALAALVASGGCTRIRDHKGYVAENALIAAIQPGIDNADSVAKTLGRPSFTGQFDGGKTWYYVARDTSAFAFSNPKPSAQTTLEVRFDAAGNDIAIDKSGLEKVVNLSPAGGKTPTLGRKSSFFGDLFGNIGHVGATNDAKGGSTDNPD